MWSKSVKFNLNRSKNPAGILRWLLAIGVVWVAGCLHSDGVEATRPGEENLASGQNPDANRGPVVSPGGGGGGTGGRPGEGSSGEVLPPSFKPLLLLSGGSVGLGFNLYTLSPLAREGFPEKFSGYNIDFRSPQPLSGFPGRVVAIAKERYEGKPESIELIHFGTGRSYTLFRAKKLNHRLSGLTPSPDGKWVAFRSEDPSVGGGRIGIVNVETEQWIEIAAPNGADDREPAFSADEKQIAWVRKEKEKMSVVSLVFEAGERRDPRVVVSAGEGEALSYFHFGTDPETYFYLKQTPKTSKLFLRRKGQAAESSLLPEGNHAYEPSWSPDGNQIVFWSESKEAQRIQTYDLKRNEVRTWSYLLFLNGDPERLGLRSGESAVCPAFAPDQSAIYFTSKRDVWHAILRVTLDSSTRVTQMTDASISPSYFCPRVMADFRGVGG